MKLQRDAEANEVLLLAVREQLAVRDGELSQCQLELEEQKGKCRTMEASMNLEMASRERTERELKTAHMQRDAIQGQLDRSDWPQSFSHLTDTPLAAKLHLLLHVQCKSCCCAMEVSYLKGLFERWQHG